MTTPCSRGTPLSAGAWRLLPLLLVFLAGCAEIDRIPHTLDDQLEARVPGYDDIRFHADMATTELDDWRGSFLPAGPGADGRANWLVLSAGGSAGAFGAGVLTGWSARGDRPEFDLVTGISAGALIAPFAFVGQETDPTLAKLFTTASVAEINRSRSLVSGVFGRGVISNGSLRAVINRHLSQQLLDRIEARHRTGARLLVVTTNLDAQRSVVWDIGAIAASGRPDRRDLIGHVLEASASIPAIFPPVRIRAQTGGTAFGELHADGAVIRRTYFLPDSFQLNGQVAGPRPQIFVIVNGEIAPSFAVVRDTSFRIAERALLSLEKAKLTREVTDIAQFARRNRAEFRLAHIDRTLPNNRRIPFDPNHMRSAFELGQSKGRSGAWETTPPVGTGLLEAQ